MQELNKIKELFDDFIKEADKLVSKVRVEQTIPEKTIYWGETAEKEMTWEEAKDWCTEQGGRLPTKNELLQAHKDVDGFLSSYYWSATEYGSTAAYGVNFSECATYYYSKTIASYVRCVFDK